MSDYNNPNKGFIKFKKHQKKKKKLPVVIFVALGIVLIFLAVLFLKSKYSNRLRQLFSEKQHDDNIIYAESSNNVQTEAVQGTAGVSICRSGSEPEAKEEFTITHEPKIENKSTITDEPKIENESTIDGMPYWVIFHEGCRDGRLEISTFRAKESFRVVWSSNLKCNNQIGRCNQYYFENKEWKKIGTYGILTDMALDIVASNVDIYDENGVLIHEKTTQQFSEIESALSINHTNNDEPKIANGSTIDGMPYWVIFHEGCRDGRLELSTFRAEKNFCVVWSSNLKCNNQIGRCNQYYFENGVWKKIGTYGILTDMALDIVASNVDIYDENGVLIHEKTTQSFGEIELLLSAQF